MQNGVEENKGAEAVKVKNKRGVRGRGWLVFFSLLLFLLAGGGGLLCYKMDELNEFVRAQITIYAQQYLDAELEIGTLSWRPVLGLSVRDVTITRDGRTLLSAKRLFAAASVPSIVSGSPRLARVAIDGLETTMDDALSLVPKTEKNPDEPLNIPIEVIFIKESKIATPYGDAAIDSGALRIDDSSLFDAEINLTMNGVDFALNGVVSNSRGAWSAQGVKVEAAGGSVEISGGLYPSHDVKFEMRELDISVAEKLAPQIAGYGVSGRLSGSGSASFHEGELFSEGEGTIDQAVVRGLPLDGVAVKWSASPELIKAELNKGKVFDSELAGSFELDLTHPDKYLKLSAAAKNLKFDDWKDRIANGAAGAVAPASGEISLLSANLEGPLNALKGSVELGPSQVGYKQIVLRNLRGTATFDGKPAGTLDLSATSEGRKLSISGTLSFGDKIPTNLTFSSEGVVLDKVLQSFPQTSHLKTDGSVAVSGTCKGLFGKWIIGLRASSPAVTVGGIGEISKISAIASYSLESGELFLESASAQWNGATATASGTFSAKASGALDFKGTFKNADVKSFYVYSPPLESLNVTGVANGEWEVTGTAAAPLVTGTVRTGSAQFRTLNVEKLEAGVQYSGHTLKLSPVTAEAAGGVGTVDCDVSLAYTDEKGERIPSTWSMSGEFSNVDFSIINGLLNANEDISGEVSGKVTAGSAGDGLHWSFDFSGKNLAWREFRADELSALITGSPDEILIKNASGLFLKGETSGDGCIAMPKPGQPFADCEMELRVNIKKLNLYELTRRHLPTVRSVQGLLEGDVVVSGTVGSPRFDGKAHIAPFRYRGLMLPMINIGLSGTMREIKITEAKALLRDGNLGAHGRFWSEEGAWHGDFKIDGKDVDIRQIGGYLPDNVRSRIGGKMNFNMEGNGSLAEISGSGSVTSKELTLMGIKFEDISAPFLLSKHYVIVEDLNAKTNGGVLSGGAGFNFKDSRWGGNITVMGADLKTLIEQAAPDMTGTISGKADLIIRGGGETGRLSTLRGGGALSLTDGEISGFDFVEKAKKFTAGKPLRFHTLQAAFNYMDGIFTLLPGSQAIAPPDDTIYHNIMLDGMINSEKEISFFALGKINIRALNSLLGAFQGLINVGSDITSGELDKDEALQRVLGGFISGFARNEFRFISMGIGGTVEQPTLNNIMVSQAANMRSTRTLIPSKGGDPEDDQTKDDNRAVRFRFEIPIGPGTTTSGGFNRGDFIGQTLENLVNNIEFGL